MAALAGKQRSSGSSMFVRIGKKVRPGVNRILANHSAVGDQPVFDSQFFAFTRLLESKATNIAEEARNVLAERNRIHPVAEVSPDHERIAQDKRWKSFFLLGYGYRFDHNCALCPETTRVLEQIPDLNSGFFSILQAGAKIPPHRGVTKAILTCHLGLQVPEDQPNCAMRVADQVCHWDQGKSLVFDDTFEHEVWNRTSQDRVILLLQFKRPMSWRGRLVGDLFLQGVRASSFVQQGRRNMVTLDQARGYEASSSRWFQNRKRSV